MSNTKMASNSGYPSGILGQPGNLRELILYEKETRSQQTCSLCQNHGISEPKKGHSCKNESDNHLIGCEPCRKTILRRNSAAKDKKNNYKKKRGRRSVDIKLPGKQRSEQKCRKCANHGIDNVMREHKLLCQFKSCQCEECLETDRRRNAVKQEAKEKRMNAKNNKNSSPNPLTPNTSEFTASSPASSEFSDTSDSYQNGIIDVQLNNSFIKSEFMYVSPNKNDYYVKQEHAYAYEPAILNIPDASNFYVNPNQNLNDNSMELDLISDCHNESKRVYFTNDENTNTFANTAVYYENSDTLNYFVEYCGTIPNFNDNDYKSVLHGIYQGEFNLYNVEKDLECWLS